VSCLRDGKLIRHSGTSGGTVCGSMWMRDYTGVRCVDVVCRGVWKEVAYVDCAVVLCGSCAGVAGGL